MKSAPDVSTGTPKSKQTKLLIAFIVFEMTPVDFVSDVICSISLSPLLSQQYFGHYFHILNTKKSIQVNQISQTIQKLGYTLEILPFLKWRTILSELIKEKTQDNILVPLIHYFDNKFPSMNGIEDHISRSVFEQNGLICPQVTEDIILCYIMYYVKLGVIDLPKV